jgi:acetylornithine/N-succinyldiaminopimelate aminotransferase
MHYDRTHLMPVTSRLDPLFVRGRGSYIWDSTGRRYLDFLQGWAVNALGHCPDEVTAALLSQASSLLSASPALCHPPLLELAEKLVRASGMQQAHFANSGTEANEIAFELARKWGRLHRSGAYEILTTDHSFHGRTLASMAASGKHGFESLFPPLPSGFRKVPYGDLDAMRRAVTPSTAAILVEPIQGEPGVIVPPDGYLAGLRKVADEAGVLLILDEIQTGMGRTGTLFAYQREAVLPDIATLGKGLGSGVPIAAVLARGGACCFEPGDQGGTFNGNPLTTAVGCAVLDVVSNSAFLDHVCARGAELERGLRTLAYRFSCRETRGRGLLWAVELDSPHALAIRDRCLALGLLVNAARPNVLRFMPSLRVSSKEIAEALTILEEAMASVLAPKAERTHASTELAVAS